MDKNNVGKLHVDSAGNLWTCVSYCEQPTITFRRVHGSDTRGGAVGSRIVEDLAPVYDQDGHMVVLSPEDQGRDMEAEVSVARGEAEQSRRENPGEQMFPHDCDHCHWYTSWNPKGPFSCQNALSPKFERELHHNDSCIKWLEKQ